MKRKHIFLIAIFAVVIGLGALWLLQNTPAKKNDRILARLTEKFSDEISLCSQAEIVETQSVCGKLYGNGNGMQYFGAVLVKVNSVQDVDALLAELDQTFEFVGAEAQKGSQIQAKYLAHASLQYDTAISNDDQYITIWFFESSHPDSDRRDIRGH